MARNSKRDRRQHSSKMGDGRHGIERPRLGRRIAKRQRMTGRHEQIAYRVVVTAGATQPNAMPSIEDFALSRREEKDARDGRPLSSEQRPTALGDAAAADDPRRVLAAAPERPAPGDAIAALHDGCLAERPKCSGGAHQSISAIDFTCRLRGQISAECSICSADC